MKNLFRILCILLPLCSQSQVNYSWHFQSNGTGTDAIYDQVVMSNNDVVTYGTFSNRVDFDRSEKSHLLNATNGFNFLSRMTADGEYIWAVNFDSSTNLNIATIIRDNADDIYVSGYCYGIADMDPTTDTVMIRTPQNQHREFYAKYSGLNGHLIYLKQFDFGYPNVSPYLSTDANNNLIVSGDFSGTIDVDAGPGTFILNGSPSSRGTYIAKYDPSGSIINAVFIEGDYNSGQICTDAANNIYVSGTFRDTVDVDPGVGIFNLYGGYSPNMYVFKLSPSLQFVRAISLVSTSSLVRFELTMRQNHLLIGGRLKGGTTDFDGSNATAQFQASNDAIFFTMQDTTLSYVSGFIADADNNSTNIYVNSMCIDSQSNVYFLGTVRNGGIDLDPTAASHRVNSNSNYCLFIAKYSSAGNYIWHDTIASGTNSSLSPFNIITGRNDRIYTCGDFKYNIDIAPGQQVVTLNVINNGFYDFDGYLAAYDQCVQDSNTVNVSICDGSYYLFADDTLRHSGKYIHRFTSSAICDSIVVLNLNVPPINTQVCSMQNMLFSDETNATFQWYNCDNSSIVNGATSNNYFPDNSSYSLIVTKNGCSDTSECIQLYSRGNAGLPQFAWANSLYGINGLTNSRVRVDSKDNIVVWGSNSDNFDCDLLGQNLHEYQLYNGTFGVIAKYDGNRNYISGFVIGPPDYHSGSSGGIYPLDMILDDDDNIYVVANFTYDIDLDPGPGETVIVQSSNFYSFIAKYTPAGQFLWYQPITYSGVNCLFHDHLGNVFICGNGGPSPQTSIKVEELDSTGSLVWQYNTAPAQSFDDCDAITGTCDRNNNIYIGGFFEGTVDFDPGPAVQNVTAATSDFVVKFDVNHQFKEVRHNFGFRTTALAADCDTNVLVSTSDGIYSRLYKLDVMNHIFHGGSGVSITTDNKNNMYFLYNLTDTVIAGSDTIAPTGGQDFAFSKYDDLGNYAWTVHLGSSFNETGLNIATDRKDNIYITGTFADTLDADAGPGVFNIVDHFGPSAFLIKYGQTCAPVDTSVNPDTMYISAHNNLSWYQWIDCNTGLPVPYANGPTLAGVPAGNYKVVIYQGGCVDTSGCHYTFSTVGIEKNSGFEFNVYPNPLTDGQLTVTSPEEFCEINITNAEGKIILNNKFNDHMNSKTLDISRLAEGIYNISVVSVKGNVGRKMLVKM